MIQSATQSLRRMLSLTWQASPGWTLLAAAAMFEQQGRFYRANGHGQAE